MYTALLQALLYSLQSECNVNVYQTLRPSVYCVPATLTVQRPKFTHVGRYNRYIEQREGGELTEQIKILISG